MAEEKNAPEPTADENAPAASSELSDGQLDEVAGGVRPLHTLAQVTQVKARAVIDDGGPLPP